ncbi:hypothetical protein MGG_14721 [Pyricularia oryzae 70-15]|uniref:Uncharacterized protein n=1 Tax=Pyricularia oryzae (strain 70-15 / ATCC MYA-4617 / FGSC 8958) TaxID=242507 RepID=G4NF11_PYRO7|nr:uncharacterized protein MGG_14721 [Pyricularia oryzae 70-15]EHA49530.1 hypothetical protein MGG_14721 [Pyricularia oryzae 70-15]KAI7911796.1 hypothetical protein M0657_010762 [Pyricularia oryzae]
MICDMNPILGLRLPVFPLETSKLVVTLTYGHLSKDLGWLILFTQYRPFRSFFSVPVGRKTS